MKRTTNTTLMLSASLILACIQLGIASPSEVGLDGLLDGIQLDEAAGGPSVKGVVNNGKGTATYMGRKVWEGRIRNDLKVVAKTVSGRQTKYADGTELAAAWDGNKLLWENVDGAGQELEPERRKMEEWQRANQKRRK